MGMMQICVVVPTMAADQKHVTLARTHNEMHHSFINTLAFSFFFLKWEMGALGHSLRAALCFYHKYISNILKQKEKTFTSLAKCVHVTINYDMNTSNDV